MKKQYIIPEIKIYEVEIENCCVGVSPANDSYRVTLHNNEPSTYSASDPETEYASSAYRTTLWGD